MNDMEMEMSLEDGFDSMDGDEAFDCEYDTGAESREEDEAFSQSEMISEGLEDGIPDQEEMLIEVDGALIPLGDLAAETGFFQETHQDALSPYMELLERYPHLRNGDGLPPQVAGAIREGANPVVAYQDFLLTRKQAAERIGQLREALRARCPGSAAGYGDGDIDGDFAAFDAALNGF